MEVSGQLHAPAALAPGKELPILIRYEACWVPQAVWTLWRKENSGIPMNEPGPPSPYAVTELSDVGT
jgi:hypothetical protein